MGLPKCLRCQHEISVDDTVAFEGDAIAHLDCRRPRDLNSEERALLFKYCFDHAVAECERCAKSYRQHELAADLMGNRTLLCPTCCADLTDAVRAHLYGCAMLPEEVRLRAREARDAARKLVKRSQEIAARADVLMREAEAAVAHQSALLPEVRAALAALHETMRRVASREEGARPVGMPERLREQACEAIRSGQLPARPPDRNLTQHGRSGAACPVCGEMVTRGQVEVEIQFRRQGLGWDRYHLHPRCFAAWEFERNKL